MTRSHTSPLPPTLAATAAVAFTLLAGGCGSTPGCAISAQIAGAVDVSIDWLFDDTECTGGYDDVFYSTHMWWTQGSETLSLNIDCDLEDVGEFDTYVSYENRGDDYGSSDCKAVIDTYEVATTTPDGALYTIEGSASCSSALEDIFTDETVTVDDLEFMMNFREWR